MKKTLIAVAALSAMAASAMAANVTLYGKIDQGFQVQSKKVDGKDRDTTWKGVSGISSGSRWGLKGTEQIADGYTVGFVLESGFDGMDAEFGDENRLFNRDAFLTLNTPFGMLTVGRTGKLSDGNTGDIIAGKASPFGTSYKLASSTKTTFVGFDTSRTNRAVRYVSPKFAGVQLHAEYANMNGGDKQPNKQRYGGVGVSYANGPFYAAMTAETIRMPAGVAGDDPQAYGLAANYDFGVAKVFAGYQYAKESAKWGDLNAGTLGVSAPVAGGMLMASVAYAKGDDSHSLTSGAIGYKYSLSKRMYLYTDVAYAQEKAATTKVKTKTTEFNLGICHSF